MSSSVKYNIVNSPLYYKLAYFCQFFKLRCLDFLGGMPQYFRIQLHLVGVITESNRIELKNRFTSLNRIELQLIFLNRNALMSKAIQLGHCSNRRSDVEILPQCDRWRAQYLYLLQCLAELTSGKNRICTNTRQNWQLTGSTIIHYAVNG